MKKTSLAIVLTAVLGLSMLTACGGGGGGGSQAPQAPSTPAVLTLSTTATSPIPATTTINSYDVTIPLPAGVTVKTLPSSETDAGVVTASGSATGAFISGLYTAATGTYPATVKVLIAKVNADGTGFNPGEFCKVNVDIAGGYTYTPSNFTPPTLDDVTGFDTLTTSTVTTALQGQLSLSSAVVIN
jgi:hypothetical protein